MNADERAKARAVARCTIPDPEDRRFARAMDWLARHEPDTVLSPKQRWALDEMVYRFRRQLAGTDAFVLPTAPPRLEDFERPARGDRRRQLTLGL